MIGVARTESWFVWMLAIVLIGSRQHAFTILGHEAAHGNAHRKRSWNDALGWICMGILGIDFAAYRRFHAAHHRAPGSATDPEFETRWLQGTWPFGQSPLSTVCGVLALLFGVGALHFLRIGWHLRPRSVRSIAAVAGPWALMLAVFGSCDAGAGCAAWWIAMFTVSSTAFRIREVTEHSGIVGTHRIEVGPLARFLFFPHRVELHFEHHRWANVPFHLLPRAREQMVGPPPTPLRSFLRRGSEGGLDDGPAPWELSCGDAEAQGCSFVPRRAFSAQTPARAFLP